MNLIIIFFYTDAVRARGLHNFCALCFPRPALSFCVRPAPNLLHPNVRVRVSGSLYTHTRESRIICAPYYVCVVQMGLLFFCGFRMVPFLTVLFHSIDSN